jgi:hypothetical protein
MIQELDEVVLACDLPEPGLAKGDIGVVVLVHNKGEGFEVEFMTLDGETVAVETLLRRQVRPIKKHEIAHARELVPA